MEPIPLIEKSLQSVNRIQRLMRLFSVVIALVVGLFLALSSFYKSKAIDFPGLSLTVDQSKALKALAVEVEGLRTQLLALKTETQKAIALPTDAKLALQLSQMENATRELATRLEKLEVAILASPSKALEIPLLQRDLENLRSIQQSNLLAVKEGIDRLYDINKWLLGAMAISIITLALSNFLKSKDATGEKK